ncbi:uncharacterized protein LOC142242536 [Haematobia irritans]|uniref:uncharacterized protein LOC142242536 n=1 Tax=Haematobia irritans TaxID=7368 RepID=UPI003F509BC6
MVPFATKIKKRFGISDANVTYRSLRYLNEQDLKEAVPPLGFRAEFREKLSIWKKKFCIQKDLSEPEIGHCRTPSKKSFGTSILKDLNTLLNETSRGKSIIAFEHQHKHLTDSHRDDIISIIIEEVINNNLVLHSQDFLVLFNDICSVFPCENEMQDYYYIPRKGKNNACGKLYSKYKNKCLKKKRLLSPTLDNHCKLSNQSHIHEHIEIDESIVKALKTSLKRDCSNWENVCER